MRKVIFCFLVLAFSLTLVLSVQAAQGEEQSLIPEGVRDFFRSINPFASEPEAETEEIQEPAAVESPEEIVAPAPVMPPKPVMPQEPVVPSEEVAVESVPEMTAEEMEIIVEEETALTPTEIEAVSDVISEEGVDAAPEESVIEGDAAGEGAEAPGCATK